MKLEIEKKYLLKSAKLVEMLAKDGLCFEEQKLTQFYTKITKTKEIRFRKTDSAYTVTTKEGIGLVRKESEKRSDADSFKREQESKIGNSIEKKRYTFKYNNLPCCIDVYRGDLKGLVVLEVEFLDEENAKSFLLPPYFEQEVQKEVTCDEAFKNRNLALYGYPALKKEIDTVTLFEKIEQEPFVIEPQEFLSSGIDAYTALRIIFFSLFQRTLAYRNGFLKKSDNEVLHQFRVNIRKTRSLLQCVDGIFEESIARRFIDDFKRIANATNTKRDGDVFVEFLEGLDEQEAELVLEVFKIQENKSIQEIHAMLIGEDFNRVMQEWNMVLEDNEGFFQGQCATSPLKKVVAISLLKRLERMKKRLSVLEESTELFYFHKVRIEFKRLRYLAEYFLELFEHESIQKMMVVSKKMQTLFGELQDRDVGLDILDALENNEEFSGNVAIVYAINEIAELISHDVYDLRTKILMRKEKLFETFGLCIEALKIYK